MGRHGRQGTMSATTMSSTLCGDSETLTEWKYENIICLRLFEHTGVGVRDTCVSKNWGPRSL